MQMIPKWNRSQVSSNPLLLLLRTSRLNHGSLKHSEPTSQLVCSTLLEEKQSPFPLCTKNMRIWNEKSSIDGFQPCQPLSKLFYIKGIKAFFLLHFLRVHSFHSAWVGTTFIWQIFSCRAPTSAIITFHQIWSNMNQNNFLSDWQPLFWVSLPRFCIISSSPPLPPPQSPSIPEAAICSLLHPNMSESEKWIIILFHFLFHNKIQIPLTNEGGRPSVRILYFATNIFDRESTSWLFICPLVNICKPVSRHV